MDNHSNQFSIVLFVEQILEEIVHQKTLTKKYPIQRFMYSRYILLIKIQTKDRVCQCSNSSVKSLKLSSLSYLQNGL